MIKPATIKSLLDLLESDREDRLNKLYRGTNVFQPRVKTEVWRCHGSKESVVDLWSGRWHKWVSWFWETPEDGTLLLAFERNRLGRWGVPPPSWKEWENLKDPRFNTFETSVYTMTALWHTLRSSTWRSQYQSVKPKAEIASTLRRSGVEVELLVSPTTTTRSADRASLESWISEVDWGAGLYSLRSLEEVDDLIAGLRRQDSTTELSALGDSEIALVEDILRAVKRRDAKAGNLAFDEFKRIKRDGLAQTS